jgi:enamine deaminase RidA (YjgF/YER057c/UK114 family)
MGVKHINHSDRTSVSFFTTGQGSDEYFILIRSKLEVDLQLSLNNIYKDYGLVMDHYGLSKKTIVFTKYFLGDIYNEFSILKESDLFSFGDGAGYSVIEQTPAFTGGGMYLLAYHLNSSDSCLKLKYEYHDSTQWRNSEYVEGENYSMLWTGNYSSSGELDSWKQSEEVFDDYSTLLDSHKMNMHDNTVRTWIYVRDIDNHYQGMVESRKKLFKRHNLDQDTRYIASTGIEGKSREPESIVTMDTLSFGGLEKDQIVRMDAPGYMCPTIDYGVTFERGTRVCFGDRSHFYISGTASIDLSGEVMYERDVVSQTERAIINIEQLMKQQGATLLDMAYYIVYLRNQHNMEKVKNALSKYLSDNMLVIYVEGAVCRPTWLVEIEGVGMIEDSNNFPNFL